MECRYPKHALNPMVDSCDSLCLRCVGAEPPSFLKTAGQRAMVPCEGVCVPLTSEVVPANCAKLKMRRHHEKKVGMNGPRNGSRTFSTFYGLGKGSAVLSLPPCETKSATRPPHVFSEVQVMRAHVGRTLRDCRAGTWATSGGINRCQKPVLLSCTIGAEKLWRFAR